MTQRHKAISRVHALALSRLDEFLDQGLRWACSEHDVESNIGNARLLFRAADAARAHEPAHMLVARRRKAETVREPDETPPDLCDRPRPSLETFERLEETRIESRRRDDHLESLRE